MDYKLYFYFKISISKLTDIFLLPIAINIYIKALITVKMYLV